MKSEEAIPYFLRAEALDPDFTMASLWAVFAYGMSNQPAPADSILQALDGRRGQLAPLDRLLLDYQLAQHSGDYRGALEVMRRFLDIAPGSEFLWKAGQAALLIGRPGEAIEFLTQADPESGWLRGWVPYWFVLTRAYHEGGEYERELEAVDRWRQLHPETPEMLRAELRTLAALGRIEELSARVLGAIQRGQPMGGWSRELRAHGYPAAASDLADRTLEWFDQTSDWRQDPRQFLAYGRFLSQAGPWDEAQAVLEEMLRAVPQHNDAALELAYVLASQGHRDQAFRAVGLTRGSDDLIVRAWVEAALGERERAMELLRENGYTPRMQGLHGLASMSRFSTLWDYPPFQEFTRPQG